MRVGVYWFLKNSLVNTVAHKQSVDCECELYGKKCERYHIVNCENRTKTITQYSKE